MLKTYKKPGDKNLSAARHSKPSILKCLEMVVLVLDCGLKVVSPLDNFDQGFPN